MDQGQELIRLAVFGQPVKQSLSPRIHGLFAQQLGLNVEYRAIESTESTFADDVSALAASGARGCNVTAPFKQMAFTLASHHSEIARQAQAANTLVFETEWRADNTDGRGLVADLQRNGLSRDNTACIALLGAGGAAAGVIADLLSAFPGELCIANRTQSRAKALAQRFSDLGNVFACEPHELLEHGPFDALVNATSAGHQGEHPVIQGEFLNPDALLYDMNYGAAAGALEAHCLSKGIRYCDGIGMLVGQAAVSFEIWTGLRPNTEIVIDQIRNEIGD